MRKPPEDYSDFDPPLSDDELTEIRAAVVIAAAEYIGTTPNFTCDTCPHKRVCPFVFDPYNTNGDCLGTK